MGNCEVVESYIRTKQESEFVDFKEKMYTNLSQSDLAKDVAAFANGSAQGDKYIIMGIDDKERNMVGIPEEMDFDASSIENHVMEKIEPRIMIECGEYKIDGKRIVYIKIPQKNDNPPYVIKTDGARFKQGDIFVRIGTCNRKAAREDIDSMYKRNIKANIKIYGQSVYVQQGKEDLGEAKVEIELINPTSNPILINGGYVNLSNEFDTIEREAMSFGEDRRLDEKPLLLKANSREKKTLQFRFLSDDCLRLRFNDEGNLQYSPYIKVELHDTDGNIYFSEKENIIIFARGNVLHKIQSYYKQFRTGLVVNENKMIKAVASNDNVKLEKILNSFTCNLSFLERGYVLGDNQYPEYDVVCSVIRVAKENGNDEAIEILYKHQLSKDFVDFCTKN